MGCYDHFLQLFFVLRILNSIPYANECIDQKDNSLPFSIFLLLLLLMMKKLPFFLFV
eukprot:UN06126